MLRKLQHKFILINMALVGIVMLIGFCSIITTTYKNQKADIDRSLTAGIIRMAKDSSAAGRPFLGGENPENEDENGNELLPTYTVIIDSDGNYLGKAQGIAYMSSKILHDAIKLTYNVSATTGKLGKLGLYYRKMYTGNDSIIIAFADASQLHGNILSIVSYSAILFITSMVVLFLISYLLAQLTIRPVKRAWGQQQQFVADASHELKTPLTVILANNRILLSHKNQSVENQEKWIESSQAEATHMKNLVDNLLYLARVDAEKDKMVFSQVPLGEIIMDSVLQLEPVAFEKGVELDYNEVDGEIKLLGDSTKLYQLIHILVDNGIKYGEKNGTVKIVLKQVGFNVTLSVKNGGIPIKTEDIPHIFERFYRSDKVRTQQNQEGGYGLGLAIAKSIVEEHNGKIKVISNETEGTTFIVEMKVNEKRK